MQNKILIVLEVPSIEKKFNVFLPINKQIASVIVLMTKAISELTAGGYVPRGNEILYDKVTGEKYPVDVYIKDSKLKNGSIVILV